MHNADALVKDGRGDEAWLRQLAGEPSDDADIDAGAGNVALDIARAHPVRVKSKLSASGDGAGGGGDSGGKASLAPDKFLRHSLESERAFPALYGITPRWIKAMAWSMDRLTRTTRFRST